MNKSKIEWTDYSWNPIKGACPVGCWYCYARKIYKRFGWGDFLRLEHKTLDAPMPKKPSKIFVCSTMEMFHVEIKASWRDCIFDQIKRHPQHTFQILTKFPQNIDRPMPDNVWLGVSIDNVYDFWRARELKRETAKIKFISFEPLLGQIWNKFCYDKRKKPKPDSWLNWIIVGRLTGYGKKHDPKREWIEHIVETCRSSCWPIFLKDNLKEIWGEPLIQEWPENV